jgi:lipopolysaccharide/colanic/teichoic acid biosynthesis glycosyltransferase
VKHSHRVYDAVKRLLDVIASAVLLVVLSPVLAVTAILVASRLGRPVLFRQPRPGRGGRVFTILKFRSMRGDAPVGGAVEAVATDAERLTPFGRTLRSTSLDELPELVNVLLGHMSIVGPRPLLPEYLGRYNEEQARRHEVRPGITGWAQVNGRNAVAWKDRLAMDVWYVDHRSFALDARILLMTVRAVFSREGVAEAGHPTMRPFDPDEDRTKDRGDT